MSNPGTIDVYYLRFMLNGKEYFFKEHKGTFALVLEAENATFFRTEKACEEFIADLMKNNPTLRKFDKVYIERGRGFPKQ